MSWVTDRVAVASQWHLHDEDRLVKEGFTHVLIVAHDVNLPQFRQLTAAKFPWWKNRSLEMLYEAIYFIDEATVEGKVLIICAAGLERSPLTVLAYLMYKGYSLEQARQTLLKGRPQSWIHLEWLRDIGFLIY